MFTVGERIKRRRKQLKLSVDELAEKIGKNRATIYRYESDEIDNMPLVVLEPLAEALNVTPAYLMGWDQEKKSIQLTTAYPFYPVSISAGQPIAIDAVTEEDVETIAIPDAMMGKWAGRKDIFITRINGDSMNKVMPHNSLIAVKPVEVSDLKNGDIVVYQNGYEYSVKRFYKNEDKLIFRPDSNDQSFTDQIYNIEDSEDLKIKGKVVLYIIELD